MKISWHHRWRLLGSLLLVGLMQRLAPWARAQDTQWFRLDGIPQTSVGLEIDGSRENTTTSGTTSTYNSMFITPTVGLRTSGSIYHPNLLAFDFDGEFGWGYENMTSSGPGYKDVQKENDTLLQYLLEINLLQEKPYNASFFAAQDQTYRDYGAFDTFKVNSTRYGGRMSYNNLNLSLTTDFGYRNEIDTGLTGTSEIAETYVNFLGINHRQSGQTTMTARYDEYDNTLDYTTSYNSSTASVGLADAETFGQRKQITAASSISFSHAEYSPQQMDTVAASENISMNLRPNLDSFLNLDMELNDLHPTIDTQFQGVAGLRHQLYESLTSTLDAHGSYQESSGSGNTSTFETYGLGLAESYTKRLQSWGRLSISGAIIGDHQDDTSTGGDVTTVDEMHVLYLSTSPQYRPVFLNHPEVVDSSVIVTSGSELLVQGSDYELVPSGQLTEVRLIVPPSVHLQTLLGAKDNLPVAVTYQSQSANNASYETLTGNFQIRLDLPHGFGVYGRVNWIDNNAPPQVLAQTLTDLIGGVDYQWRWFRTGAEYEDYNSNYTQYQSWRLLQDFDFVLNDRSTLNFAFNENFYHYDATGDQTQLVMLARYSVRLWSSLSLYVQGGCSYQDVLGSKEVQGAAQTGLIWTRGKLSIRAGYEYNNQATSSSTFTQDYNKNRFFAYFKRTF